MFLTSIRNKLIVFSCAISLIPLVLVLMVCYQMSGKTLTKNTLNELAAIAESKRLHFNCFMAAKRDRVVDFSSDGFIRTRLDQMSREGVKKGRTVASLNHHLTSHKKPLDPYIITVIVLNLDGTVVAASSEELMGVNMSDHEVFTMSVDKSYGMTHVVQPGCFPFLEKQCIPVSAPVVAMRGGETIGVIAIIYDIAVLSCLTTNRTGMGETGEVYLVNRNKRMFTESRFVRSAPVLQVVDTEPVQDMIEKGKETAGIYPDYRHVPVLGVSRYLQEYDWLLLAEVDTSEAFAPIRALGIVVAVLGVGTMVIVVSCGVLFAVSTAAPIVKLKYATERLAGGDLAYRTGVVSRDEIGALAVGFNAMAEVLSREIAGHIQARKKLAERENYLKTIIDSEPDCVKLTDANGIILEMNAAGMAMVGVDSFAQVIGRTMYSIIVPEYHEAFHAHTKCVFKGDPGVLEYEIVGDKGTRLWLETNAVPLRTEKDEIIAMLSITRDITGRKKLEEKIRQSEARFRNLTESTSDWVWELNKDGVFTYVSPKARDILGYEPEEIVGKTPFALMTIEEAKRVTEFFVATSASKKPFSMFESAHIHKDGSPVVIDTSGTPILDAKGDLLGYRGINRDVTGRKKMENELRKRDAQYTAMLNTIPDGFWVIDKQGRLLDVNDAYCRMIGYSRDELLGMSVSDVEAMETYEETVRHIRRLMETGSDIFETRHRCKDGGIIQIEVCACYYLIDGGRIFSFLRDITYRKVIEENLRKLSCAVEQSASTIVITDEKANIEYANPKFTETTGYTFEEAKGQNPRILKSDQTPPEVYVRLWGTITSGREWRGEFCNKKKNGELYYESASIAPIKNTKGVITHFVAVKEDITEQKQKEEELRRTVEEKKKSIEDLQHLMEFSNLMREEIVEGVLIKHLARVLKERFNPDFLAVLMLNKEENSVDVPAIEPVMPWNEVVSQEVMLDPTLCRVMRTGHTAVVHDVDTDACCDCLLLKMKEGGYACFPLLAGGVAVGAVMMAKHERGYWNSREKQYLISAYIGLTAASLENVRLINQAKRLAITDALTGVYNRKFFVESFEKQLSLAKRYKETLAVIMADVDHFKRFNDTYGHTAGDRVLQQVSKMLGAAIRESDILCRYGGEEFVIVMPRTNTAESYEKAEKIRRHIESARFTNIAPGSALGITISMGIASFPEHGVEYNALVDAADSALYKAKKNGRNRVETS